MKHSERIEWKKCSECSRGPTGMICHEWCLTLLKANIVPINLNLSRIFRSKYVWENVRWLPQGGDREGGKWRVKSGGKGRRMCVCLHPMPVPLFLFVAFHHPSQPTIVPPPPTSPACKEPGREAYSVRHIDRVSGEAADGSWIKWILSWRLQGRLERKIRPLRW